MWRAEKVGRLAPGTIIVSMLLMLRTVRGRRDRIRSTSVRSIPFLDGVFSMEWRPDFRMEQHCVAPYLHGFHEEF